MTEAQIKQWKGVYNDPPSTSKRMAEMPLAPPPDNWDWRYAHVLCAIKYNCARSALMVRTIIPVAIYHLFMHKAHTLGALAI